MESDGGNVKSDAGPGSERPGFALARLGRAALEMIFPPVCLGCGRMAGAPDALCAPCWSAIEPITEPLCPVLGLPFAADMGTGALSPKAIADPPPFDRARAAVAYTDLARGLIAKMKYADRPEIARLCGRMMAGAGSALLGPDAVLIPVPLHRARQFSRRYNQSTELARVVARLANLPCDTDLVFRSRHTAQQVGLSARQRARNVAGAFRVDPGARDRLAGKRPVLVDDVITTGATAGAVAGALKRAGFEAVDVLSFARVVFDADMTV